MKEILLVLSAFIVAVAMPTPEAPYRAPLLSGTIWAEESSVGTGVGGIFSFGNGDSDTNVSYPHDIWIYSMGATSQTSCSGTATIALYVDESSRAGATYNFTGTQGLTTFVDPIKVDANTRVRFERTSGCSSGGTGMVALAHWVATMPDSVVFNR